MEEWRRKGSGVILLRLRWSSGHNAGLQPVRHKRGVASSNLGWAAQIAAFPWWAAALLPLCFLTIPLSTRDAIVHEAILDRAVCKHCRNSLLH